MSESSNDVEIVYSVPSNSDYGNDNNKKNISKDKPLLDIIKRLIITIKENKENVVLSNSMIIEILQKEFNVKPNKVHKLELEIYVCVLKKYLRDWPKWDELSKIAIKRKTNFDNELEEIIYTKNDSLKQYLKVMLDVSKPLAEEAVRTVNEKEKQANDESDEVEMEVFCTHNQLAQLFCRTPDPQKMNTIFNTTPIQPTVITLNDFSLNTVLNWKVKLSINLSIFSFQSSNSFKLEHTLLNKALERNYKRPFTTLDETLMIKYAKKMKRATVNQLISVVNNCSEFIKRKSPHHQQYITSIFDFVLWSISSNHSQMIIPAKYRKYLNKYAYVRYLYSDKTSKNVGDNIKYDVQLEEKMSPLQEFYIAKATSGPIVFVGSEPWLKIECLFCTVKFNGVEELDSLINHFMECHQYEEDWQCSHCNLVFNMPYLASSRWKHEC